MISKHFMPYIMVLASPSAKKKLEQNNLSPAEFLKPFGRCGDLGGYTFSSNPQSQPVKLKNFSVNFVDASSLSREKSRNYYSKTTDMVMETSKPDLDDQNKYFTRQEALEELSEKRGGTRFATE